MHMLVKHALSIFTLLLNLVLYYLFLYLEVVFVV